MAQSKCLDLVGLQSYDGKIKTLIDEKDVATLAAAKAHAEGLADNYEAAGSVATAQEALQAKIDAEEARAKAAEQVNATAASNAQSAADKAQDEVDALEERVGVVEGDVGTLENLATSAKGDLVSAINEVRASVSAGGTAAAISLDTSTTTDGALKSYTIYQGETKIGVIDIPKDMVVESGSVVVNPEGQAEGTYIKLVLANVTDPLYINVGTLVDIYTAQADATQIQITIDSSTREISATIVAGSIGTAELADNAVTTVKIADGNVTKAKLSTTLQASIDKADAAAPQTALDAEVDRAKAAEAQALTDAKAYTDEQIEAIDLSGIEANAGEIETLKTAVNETLPASIAAAKKAGDDAQADVDALETTVGTNTSDIATLKTKVETLEANGYDDTEVRGLIAAEETRAKAAEEANATAVAEAKTAAETAQREIDALEDKVGEVTEGKTVVEMIADAQEAATYDDTAVKADIKVNADAIDALEALVGEGYVAITTEEINALFTE